MNMENIFKSGNDESQVPYEEMLKYGNLLKEMFKFNVDLFGKLYQNTSNYYKYNTMMFGKSLENYNNTIVVKKIRKGLSLRTGMIFTTMLHDMACQIHRFKP
jgi:hypothetical protein